MKKLLLSLLYLCVILSCTKEDYSIYLGYKDSKIKIGGVNYNIRSYNIFSEDDGIGSYLYYRIPSIVITNDNNILVVCENRYTYSDFGEMDILLTRKVKDLAGWITNRVWNNDIYMYERSMNPIFIVDRIGSFGAKGGIFLFTCHVNHGVNLLNTAKTNEVDLVYKYSSDNGITWSKEYGIKEKCDFSNYDTIVPSAANGIQLSDGTIVLPTMVSIDEKWHSGIAYLKPGEDWRFSSPTPKSGDNECTVYTNNVGQIVLDCRTTEYIRRKYIYDIINDVWSLEAEIPVNLNLKAEIVHCVMNTRDIYFTCFCDTPNGSRENITLYGSKDGNKWVKICLLQGGFCQGGYSTPSVYGNNFYIVHETSDWGIRVIDLSNVLEEIVNFVYS